jgi:hypothetical protein
MLSARAADASHAHSRRVQQTGAPPPPPPPPTTLTLAAANSNPQGMMPPPHGMIPVPGMMGMPVRLAACERAGG